MPTRNGTRRPRQSNPTGSNGSERRRLIDRARHSEAPAADRTRILVGYRRRTRRSPAVRIMMPTSLAVTERELDAVQVILAGGPSPLSVTNPDKLH